MIKNQFGRFAVALTVAVCLQWASDGKAQDVFSLTFSGVGRVQDSKDLHNGDSIDVIKTVTINNKALINIALGNNPNTSVPANIVLGWLSDCGSGEIDAIIFDKNASSIVATVATVNISDTLDVQKEVCDPHNPTSCVQNQASIEGLADLAINVVSNSALNSIEGGDLSLYWKTTLDTNQCPAKIGATGFGSLDATITDMNGNTSDFHILIPNAKLTSGKKLATLP